MDTPRPLLRYAVPVAAVALIVFVRFLLDPLLGENSPLLLFVVAVTASAWYGGFGPGLWSTVLSTLIGAYLFLPPQGALFPLARADDAVRLALFLLVGLAVSAISEAMRAARRQAEATAAALRESEENARRQARLLEQTHDAILIWELGEGITYWNRGAERLYGFSLEEALGRASHELLATIHPLPLRDFEAMLQREGEWRGELTHTARDGRQIIVDSRQVLVQDADRQRLVLETNRDITRQKQNEQALRESEERFRVTFEQAAVGLALVGLDGRWLRVNDRLCRMTGYSRGELLARTFQQITHPEDVTAELENTRRLLAGDIPTCSMEKRYIRSDHSILWAHLTLSLVRDTATGEPRYFVAVVQESAAPRPWAEELRQPA